MGKSPQLGRSGIRKVGVGMSKCFKLIKAKVGTFESHSLHSQVECHVFEKY